MDTLSHKWKQSRRNGNSMAGIKSEKHVSVHIRMNPNKKDYPTVKFPAKREKILKYALQSVKNHP